MIAQTDAARRSTAIALWFIALITLWRVLWLLADRTTLSTDEAQYWFWGQEFAFGAYSKPPLIGWLIRAMTEVAGQSVFGVRVGAPLVHGATALLILALAQRLTPPPVAAFAAMSYVTLPAVALGSYLMTTDTPLLLFGAAALLVQHMLAQARGGWALILALGLAVGLGFMSKYAMIYVVLGMIAAASVSADWRIPRRAVAWVALIALGVVMPNLLWISTHSFATAQHVAGDAEWQGFRLYPAQALRFVAEQLAVMGPVLFVAWLAALRHIPTIPRPLLAAYALSAAPLVVVVVQALTSRALANWGVTFVLAGVIIAAHMLAHRALARRLSLGLGLIISLALPMVAAFGTDWRMPNGRLYLHRYVAQPDIIDWAIAAAQQGQARVIITEGREMLAALVWAARDTDIVINAPQSDAPPDHHWDLLYRFDPDVTPGPVYVLAPVGSALATQAARCAQGGIAPRTAGPGFVEGARFALFRVAAPPCLTNANTPAAEDAP